MDIEMTWNYKKLMEMQIHKYKKIFQLISHISMYTFYVVIFQSHKGGEFYSSQYSSCLLL
jgi:hypothetical protein